MPCPDRRLTRGAGLATVAPHGPGVNRRHPIAAGPEPATARAQASERRDADFPIVDAHVHLYDPGVIRYRWMAGRAALADAPDA